MNPHRTTDPHRRAAHIADRLEREHDMERLLSDMPTDWPRFWLRTYEQVAGELASPEASGNPVGE